MGYHISFLNAMYPLILLTAHVHWNPLPLILPNYNNYIIIYITHTCSSLTINIIGSNIVHRNRGIIANVICDTTIPGQKVSEWTPWIFKRRLISSDTRSISRLE